MTTHRGDPPHVYLPPQTAAPIGEPFPSPSMGDSYDFTVRIYWAWIGGVWGRTDLAGDVAPYRAGAWQRIMAVTRSTLRGFSPDDAQGAEEALNKKFDEMCHTEQPVPEKAVWFARAEVDMHEDIRRLRQEGWKGRAVTASEHQRSGEFADEYQKLLIRWRRLLSALGLDDVTKAPAPYIVAFLLRLVVHPESAADTVDELAKSREKRDGDLLEMLKTVIDGDGEVNLLEYEMGMDTAVRRLMQWAGLALPDDRSVAAGGDSAGGR